MYYVKLEDIYKCDRLWENRPIGANISPAPVQSEKREWLASLIPDGLASATHVFVRHDAITRPFRIIKRTDEHFCLHRPPQNSPHRIRSSTNNTNTTTLCTHQPLI